MSIEIYSTSLRGHKRFFYMDAANLRVRPTDTRTCCVASKVKLMQAGMKIAIPAEQLALP
jgi:hypothetical protein